MTTTKAFDNLNRLTSIANVGVSSGNYLASSHAYTYNTAKANQRTGVQLKDGATWAYGYDALGQVISAKKKFSDGTFVPGEQLEFVEDEWASQSPPQVYFPGRVVRFANRGGNRTSAKSGGDSTGASSALRSFSYTPNNLNQYTSRTVPNTVDVIGVANSSASVTVNSQAAYRKGEFYQKSITAANGGNQAVTVTATSGSSVTKSGNIFVPPASEAFTYDLDGNLTSDGRWNYVGDAENRLIRLTGKISGVQPTQVDYEYDWRGRRIKKVVTGTTTTTAKYLYDGWNLVAELDGNNALVRSYMWGLDLSGSMQGAGGVGGLLYTKPASGSAQFCAYDGNGNVMALVDGGNGGLTAEYEYGAFGETLRGNGASAGLNPFRFSTKFTDDESDFVYYGYRYLNPGLGRWLSRDGIQEKGGPNLFGFVANSAVGYFDYLGFGPATWPPPMPPSYPHFPDRPKLPQYPPGFSICQRNLEKGKSCDVQIAVGNACGGEHTYLQYVGDEGDKWGWGFGDGGTVSEGAFKPNSCAPCKRTTDPLKFGSGLGKSGNSASAEDIQDCIKNFPPSHPYRWYGYNCKSWAREAAKNCGLNCN